MNARRGQSNVDRSCRCYAVPRVHDLIRRVHRLRGMLHRLPTNNNSDNGPASADLRSKFVDFQKQLTYYQDVIDVVSELIRCSTKDRPPTAALEFMRTFTVIIRTRRSSKEIFFKKKFFFLWSNIYINIYQNAQIGFVSYRTSE